MSRPRDKCGTSSPSIASFPSQVTPMAIPFASEPVPPPLPPPTFIPEISAGVYDPGWSAGTGNGIVKPGSSLLGNSVQVEETEQDHEERVERKSTSEYPHEPNSTIDHEGGRKSSLSALLLSGEDQDMLASANTHPNDDEDSRLPMPNAELKGERELRQRTVELSSQTYDKRLLSRIGGPSTPKRQSITYTSHGPQENGQVGTHSLDQQALATGNTRAPALDSWSGIKWPTASAIWAERGARESGHALDSRNGSITSIDTGSHRGSYDHSMFVNDDIYMEEGQIRNLYIDDQSPRSPKAGSKRRASSPPREHEARSSVSSASGQNDSQYRRPVQQLPNRSSPVSKHHPDQLSLSSASSIVPRHGSLGSSLGMASVPSSATSYGSGRMSPSFVSPAVDADLRNGALQSAPDTADRGLVKATHQRALSESGPCSTRKLSADIIPHPRQGSLTHLQGMYVCECCPKKPRKFENEAELRQHENEKQFSCAYCSNRFKNKNEAERHQNSLHLRQHSWCCAALSGIEAAFQSSQSGNDSDICGYCGVEFLNPPQWDLRAEHINHVHKFRECNQAKKFFRADHFRQHLKHSHQGTSGKWTNILENACVKDEPLPEKRLSPIAIAPPAAQALPSLSANGISGPGPPPVTDTIEETPHES